MCPLHVHKPIPGVQRSHQAQFSRTRAASTLVYPDFFSQQLTLPVSASPSVEAVEDSVPPVTADSVLHTAYRD